MTDLAQPLANSYWVVPGRLLAGEHPFGPDLESARARLALLHGAGIDYFVDLTEAGERPDYRPLLPEGTKYLRFAIADTWVPGEFEQVQRLLADMQEALAAGRGVYVHCRAGIGRTGLVIGCYLAEQGLAGKAALKQLNRLWRKSARSKSWPKVPQTREQADYILRWPAYRKEKR